MSNLYIRWDVYDYDDSSWYYCVVFEDEEGYIYKCYKNVTWIGSPGSFSEYSIIRDIKKVYKQYLYDKEYGFVVNEENIDDFKDIAFRYLI